MRNPNFALRTPHSKPLCLGVSVASLAPGAYADDATDEVVVGRKKRARASADDGRVNGVTATISTNATSRPGTTG
jgi:hypothetical protein